MAGEAYRVRGLGDKPIDFLLAGVRGAMSGYAGGLKARSELENLKLERAIKLQQMELDRQKVQQDWDIAVMNVQERQKELLANQTFDLAKQHQQQQFDKDLSAMSITSNIMLKMYQNDYDREVDKTKMIVDLFNKGKDRAIDEKRTDLLLLNAKNESLYRNATLGVSKDRLALEAASDYTKTSPAGKAQTAQAEKQAAFDLKLKVQQDRDSLYKEKMSTWTKTKPGDRTPDQAMSLSVSSIERAESVAELSKMRTGSPELKTDVWVPKELIDNGIDFQQWIDGTYQPEKSDMQAVSFGFYLLHLAPTGDYQRITGKEAHASQLSIQQTPIAENTVAKEIIEKSGYTVPILPKEKPVAVKSKMYPMNSTNKVISNTQTPTNISKEAQDYINFVKSNGYNSVGDLPEVDVQELKKRGLYEYVVKGLSPQQTTPTITRKMSPSEQKVAYLRNRVASVFNENRIDLDILKNVINEYGESVVRKELESYAKTHKLNTSIDTLIKMAR